MLSVTRHFKMLRVPWVWAAANGDAWAVGTGRWQARRCRPRGHEAKTLRSRVTVPPWVLRTYHLGSTRLLNIPRIFAISVIANQMLGWKIQAAWKNTYHGHCTCKTYRQSVASPRQHCVRHPSKHTADPPRSLWHALWHPLFTFHFLCFRRLRVCSWLSQRVNKDPWKQYRESTGLRLQRRYDDRDDEVF